MNIGYPQDDTSSFPSYGSSGAGEVMDRMVVSSSKPVGVEPDHFPTKIAKSIEIDTEKGVDKKKTVEEKEDTLKRKDPKAVADEMAEKKKRRKKKWKKPKDKPNRPLSAYNLFFRHERGLMLGDDAPSHEAEKLKKRVHCKTHGKIGFAEMAKSIGGKWKTLDPDIKVFYELQANKEKQRYEMELAAWKQAQKRKEDFNEDAMQGFDAFTAAALARNTMGSQGGLGSPNLHSRMMMADSFQRQNLSNLLQQRPTQDIPYEYLRALQEQRQMEQSGILGRQRGLDGTPFEYPSAAEASANAIMQQFQRQNDLPQPVPQQQQQQHAQTDFLCLQQQLAMMNPNMAAVAVRRLQQQQQHQQQQHQQLQQQQRYGSNDYNNFGGGDLNMRL
jgi:hypothetical protein